MGGKTRPWLGRLPGCNISFTGVQTFVALTTGLLTIGGALLAMSSFVMTAPSPTKGHVVAIIKAERTAEAIPDARVEILTPEDEVITTLTPDAAGKATQTLEEGRYRVRVTHLRYAAETLAVMVVKGQTSELRIGLKAGSSSVLGDAVKGVKRIFAE